MEYNGFVETLGRCFRRKNIPDDVRADDRNARRTSADNPIRFPKGLAR